MCSGHNYNENKTTKIKIPFQGLITKQKFPAITIVDTALSPKHVYSSIPQYRKGTKFRGDKFSRFLTNLCLKNIRGGFIFVFAMKMIGDGVRIINIYGVNISRSEHYPRKFIPLEISYPYGNKKEQSSWDQKGLLLREPTVCLSLHVHIELV